MADPGFANEGAKVDRGAEGSEGVGRGAGVSPSPLGDGSREEALPRPQKMFLILDLKMPISSAVQLPVVHEKNCCRLRKLAAACKQTAKGGSLPKTIRGTIVSFCV